MWSRRTDRLNARQRSPFARKRREMPSSRRTTSQYSLQKRLWPRQSQIQLRRPSGKTMRQSQDAVEKAAENPAIEVLSEQNESLHPVPIIDLGSKEEADAETNRMEMQAKETRDKTLNKMEQNRNSILESMQGNRPSGLDNLLKDDS